MELRQELGALVVVGVAQIVERVPVLDGGRPPGEDVGVALQDRVRVLPLEAIHQRREAVEVIEVLEQAEPVHRGEVAVGLLEREGRRHLDRHLLVRDRGLERRLIRREQPVDHRLLVLFDPPHDRERRLEPAVEARRRMAEAVRLHLDAVHEDDPDARPRVDVDLADRRWCHLPPVESLALDRHAAIPQQM